MTTAATDWLRGHLRAHRDRHGPLYGGFLSDHLPMALLAMHGLGVGRERILEYSARYTHRLDPTQLLDLESIKGFEARLGDRSAYAAYLGFFDDAIDREGVDATVRRYLPPLVSAWISDAYHPIIRLAYGLRFGVASEVSAGLAYLASVGPRPALADACRSPRVVDVPRLPDPIEVSGRTFDRKCSSVLDSGAVASAAFVLERDSVKRMCEVALGLFNATHDFFALHLVTGTHALRICASYLDDDVAPILTAGLLTGYLAIGAPECDLAAAPTPARIDDEHDAKLAFTCVDQAAHFDSAAYLAAAGVYASGRQLP